MVKFFALDLDGCLAFPFQPPDWEAVTTIRNLQDKSASEHHIPALTLCTGRPLPYTEAVAQWLGIRHTIIFESGGGFFHPVENKLTWSPLFTPEIKQMSREIREWVSRDILPKYPGIVLEFAKQTDVGMVSRRSDEIKAAYDIATKKINDHYPGFEVHATEISVNIIVKACNKASGLQFFAERHKVSSKEMAYIGDTSGDITALKWVGTPFTPSNGDGAVREHAVVMKNEATSGVLEAYESIIASNLKEK